MLLFLFKKDHSDCSAKGKLRRTRLVGGRLVLTFAVDQVRDSGLTHGSNCGNGQKTNLGVI